MIREKLQTRFTSFREAFKVIDENRSGRVSKTEVSASVRSHQISVFHRNNFLTYGQLLVPSTPQALRMLMMLNLTNVREKVVNKLVDIMDKDGNGYVIFPEFLMAFCDWVGVDEEDDE